MKTLLRIAAALTTLVLLSTAAMAQTFPNKPIADIVPAAAPDNNSKQAVSIADALEKKINAHFKKFTPELRRYTYRMVNAYPESITAYGESLTIFSPKQITAEIALFHEVKNSDVMSSVLVSVFALCHNILIHSVGTGYECLTFLNSQTQKDKKIGTLLMWEFFFAEEFGEGLALHNLESNDVVWSQMWANYLSEAAIYESSIARIETVLQNTKDPEISQALIAALMYISNPLSAKTFKRIAETTKNDAIQAKAIFALTELIGFEGLPSLQSIRTVGKQSKEQKKSSLDWLKNETSSGRKWGTKVGNDLGFIERFGAFKSPAIDWLRSEGMLDEKVASNPVFLSKLKKDRLLDLLIEAKGFGLEAAKGHLFMSIEQTDMARLLLLRKLQVYSPNQLNSGRLKTIGIFIRHLRKTKA